MSNWIKSPFHKLLQFRSENMTLKLPTMHMTEHDRSVIEKAAGLLKDSLIKQGSVHIMHDTKENTMQNKQALQPFDLEKALAGHPVVTRDGRSVEVIGTTKRHEHYPVVAFIGDGKSPCFFTLTGASIAQTKSEEDIFMTPRMRTVYINQFKNGEYKVYKCAHEAMKEGSGLDAILFAHSIDVPDNY